MSASETPIDQNTPTGGEPLPNEETDNEVNELALAAEQTQINVEADEDDDDDDDEIDEEEEDNYFNFTKEGKEIMIIGLKTLIDALHGLED